jgi:hypothetical protein
VLLKNSLIGVQYGTGAFRVARFQLAEGSFQGTGTDILEYRSPLVSDPTTGVIVGKNFYFIANTGIDNLDEGKIIDPGKLEPVHIAVVPLE